PRTSGKCYQLSSVNRHLHSRLRRRAVLAVQYGDDRSAKQFVSVIAAANSADNATACVDNKPNADRAEDTIGNRQMTVAAIARQQTQSDVCLLRREAHR